MNQNKINYLTPTVKVVAFKVEHGFDFSVTSPDTNTPPNVAGQNEQLNRRSWNVDWNQSE